MAAIVSTRIARLQAVSPRTTGGVDQSGVVVALTNSAVSLPANAFGVVTSYATATTKISVFHAAVDATALWSLSKSDSAGVASSISGNTITVSSLTADQAQVTITATRTGYDSQVKVFSLSRAKDGSTGPTGTTGATGAPGATGTTGLNGAPGSNGARGSMTFYTSGSAWSDSVANSVITTITGSSTRIIGDTVTISNATFAATKYWSGTSWLAPGVVLDGNLLVRGTVSASDITTGSMSCDRLSGGTITGVDYRGGAAGTIGLGAGSTIGAPGGYTFYTGYVGADLGTWAETLHCRSITCHNTINGNALTATKAIDCEALRNNTGAAIYCGTYTASLETDGNFVVHGVSTWVSNTNTSDRRLKENIENTRASGLETISRLNVVDYTWKKSTPDRQGRVHTGFIAQDVMSVIPTAVSCVEKVRDEDLTNLLFLHKEEIVPFLVKAVQELSAEVNILKGRLNG